MKADIRKTVEQRVRHMSFREAVADIDTETAMRLQSSPSTVIQARIEFDALCAMELADMSPHKLRALSEHKRDLIFELSSPPQTLALPVCN